MGYFQVHFQVHRQFRITFFHKIMVAKKIIFFKCINNFAKSKCKTAKISKCKNYSFGKNQIGKVSAPLL